MPTSYYKYSERDVENQIDWSKVGKEFSTMLKNTADLREQKKADIEKATQENLKAVADAPTGLDERVTDKMINLSSQSQDYLLMMNRMLKSGQLSPKDYSIASQNLKTDVTSLFDLSKKYQTEYATYIERAQSGLANPFETWNKEKIESFTNFSKTDFIINTPTGTLSSGLKKKDPITGMEVIDYNQTLPQLKWAQSVKMDKFKTDDAVKNIIASLGEEAKVVMQGRTLMKISDITKRTALNNPAVNAYKIAEQNFVNSIVDTNPFNAQSILMMDKGVNSKTGNAYYLTDDPNDKGLATHDAILVIPDPASPGSGRTIVKLDDEQKQAARDLLTERIRIGIDKSMEGQYYEPRAQTQGEIDESNKKDEAKNLGIQIARILTGDGTASSAGGNYVTNIPGFGSIKKEGSIITINRGGDILTNDIKGKSPDQAIRQVVSIFSKPLGVNEQDVIRAALGAAGKTVNTTSKFDYAVGALPSAKPKNPLAEFKQYVDVNIVKDIVQADQETTSNNLTAKYGKFGYTFAPTGYPNLAFGGHYVTVTAPDGKTKKEYKVDSALAKNIAAFMKGNTDNKKIAAASAMGDISGINTGQY
jgi:hypothetical protein